MPDPIFQIPTQTKYGATIYTDDPRRMALYYMARLQMGGHITEAEYRPDKTVTVYSAGIEPTTYAPKEGV